MDVPAGRGAVLARGVCVLALVTAAMSGCSSMPAQGNPPDGDRPPTVEQTTGSPRPTASSTVSTAVPPAETTRGPAVTTPLPGGDVDVAVARLPVGVADEASGLAESTAQVDTYFVVDDATGVGDILAVGADGALLARIGVSGMAAGNAEALASGPCGATPTDSGAPLDPAGTCLYVGDIGDQVDRPEIVVYRLAEPAVAGGDRAVDADAWIYTYPQGPQNAEALLVEPTGTLLIITKPPQANRTVAPHRIYRGAPGGGALQFVREYHPPAPPDPLQSLLTGNVVTDAFAGAGRVLVLTYDQLVEYRASAGTVDLATFPDWPATNLQLPRLIQAEGVTGAVDGCGYAVVSEAGPGGTAASLAVATCR